MKDLRVDINSKIHFAEHVELILSKARSNLKWTASDIDILPPAKYSNVLVIGHLE